MRNLLTNSSKDGKISHRMAGVVSAQRLNGSTAQRLNGSTAQRLNGSTAQRLNGKNKNQRAEIFSTNGRKILISTQNFSNQSP
ncbi:MAG: hypothetical protein J6M05_04935 [Cardiobacteriaceae bacterium]|nr:hypothetical protein [Cardiobacteriaceae bacterium]